MAEFLANESGTDLFAQLHSSIRAGIRRTDTGVTHAAINGWGGVAPRLAPVFLKRVVVSESFGNTRKPSTGRTAQRSRRKDVMSHVTFTAENVLETFNLRYREVVQQDLGLAEVLIEGAVCDGPQ